MRRRLHALAGLLSVAITTATLVAPPIVSAAPSWLPAAPQSLPTGSDGAGATGTFAADGRGFLAWSRERPGGGFLPGYGSAVQVGAVDRSGRLRTTFKLASIDGFLPEGGRAVTSAGSVLLAGFREHARGRVSIGALQPSGRIATRASLRAPGADGSGSIASAPNGAAVALWTAKTGKGAAHLVMAACPAHKACRPSHVLTSSSTYSWSAAVSRSGAWVVTAVADDPSDRGHARLSAWTGTTASGKAHRHELGPTNYEADQSAVIDGTGRAYVLWRAQDLEPQHSTTTPSGTATWRLRGTAIATGTGQVGTVQELADGRGDGGGFAIEGSPKQGAVIEYTAADGAAHALTVGTEGSFAPTTVDIPPAGRLGPVAYMHDGSAFIGWSDAASDRAYVAAIEGSNLGPAEDTGLPATTGSLLMSGSPSDQPRVYSIAPGTTRSPRLLTSNRRP